MKKLYPKCLKKDGEFGNTTRGYLLPCCYLDVTDLFEGEFKDLVKEKFKLSEVASIEEIIESEEWLSFYQNLRDGIAPDRCYEACGKDGNLFGVK